MYADGDHTRIHSKRYSKVDGPLPNEPPRPHPDQRRHAVTVWTPDGRPVRMSLLYDMGAWADDGVVVDGGASGREGDER